MAEATDYDGKTNEELQDILKERALPISGNKEELTTRLKDDDKAKAKTGNSAKPTATADPAADAAAKPKVEISTTPELGGEPIEKAAEIQGTSDEDGVQRGGRAELDFQRAKAEKEERDQIVEFTEATYKQNEPRLLREIAEELGLTRQEDYNDLVALNNRPLEARVDAGEKVRLPSRYSYVGVEHVSGGAVKK